MFHRLLRLLPALVLAGALLHAQTPIPVATPKPAPSRETVQISLPSNPVTDYALYYQNLTGKRIIMDSNLSGPPISLVVPQPVTKEEAAALIESVLVLNGYAIVNVDEHTIKLLGPSKPARSEPVPLFTSAAQLPPGDTIVSFFMPFQYLKAEEAIAAFNAYAPNRPFGSYVAVPSVNAIVITETASVVRRLVALKSVVDVPGARVATEFFTLQNADAEKVVEVLTKLFEKNDESPAARAGNNVVTPNAPNGAPNNGQNPAAPAPPAGNEAGGVVVAGATQRVQIFADKRTNRVMVVAPESQMAYIGTVIESLDLALSFDEVLEYPLRFVRAGDVLPVLSNLLNDGDEKGGATDPKIVGDENNNQNGPGGSNSSGDSSSSSGGSSSSGLSLTEKTSFSAESTKPLSVIVGTARIIADRSVNKILVIGPPESRAKAARVLAMLDQRPKQVYLACVIGQLTLTNDLEFGIDYLMRFGDVRVLGQSSAGNIQNLLNNRAAAVDLIPGTSNAVDTATTVARTALPALSGLTVFGSIADSVDILARALGTTGRFQIISRPVVYTANGQGALISSGQEVPVPVNSLNSIVDTNNVNNTGQSVSTQIDYKRVVLQLDVRPLINSDKEVTLEIKQRNDNVQSNIIVANNEVPVIATQTLNTTVTVPNRNTIVLGGLITEQDERNSTGIPFLKDIPGVGYLFSNTKKTKTRRELIIMIQPFIINSDEALKQVQYIERSNTDFREGMFDQPVPIKPASLPSPEDLTNPKLR